MSSESVVGAVTAAVCAVLSYSNNNAFDFINAHKYQSTVPGGTVTIAVVFGFTIGVVGAKLANSLRWLLLGQILKYTGWIYNPRSRKTKLFGLSLSLLMPKKKKLMCLQEYLPRYPLTTLEETCKKTLEVVSPLLDKLELDNVRSALQELQFKDGPKLQQILEKQYAKEDNWLTPWWDKYAYLSARCSLPVNLNYAMMCQLGIQHATQCARAGNWTYSMLKYKQKIDDESLRPLMVLNLIPICNDRTKYLYSTTRIPGENMDELKRYPGSEHIVVFCNGHTYKLDVYRKTPNGKKVLLTPLAFQRIFENIMKDCKNNKVINACPLTSMERTTWAKERCRLMKNQTNAETLEAIESSIFCVSLETDGSPDDPEDLDQHFGNLLGGDPSGRWFDKCQVLVVFPNSAIGTNCEHTTAEGPFYGRIIEFCIAYQQYDENDNAQPMGNDHLTNEPIKLSWNLDEFKDVIETATVKHNALISNLDAALHITTKGKNVVKKHRISPDGFIQMAMQLAFYRRHKFTPKTYETGTTRLYKYGRTDTIRSVSKHSVMFTQIFDDDTIPVTDKAKSLRDAVEYQTQYKYDAMCGKAIDRHLFALNVAGKMIGKVPKLFSLKPFTESDQLSTSQSPLRNDMKVPFGNYICSGGGFGPQHAEGYGISYFMAGENSFHFCISCYKSWEGTSAKQFGVDIETAIDDMLVLLDKSKARK